MSLEVPPSKWADLAMTRRVDLQERNLVTKSKVSDLIQEAKWG